MNDQFAGLSRRSFINRLGAIGGTGLLLAGMEAFGMGIRSVADAPPMLAGGGNGKKVVILGAGMAGLTAAYELNRAGYAVEVIEARPFAGGRSQTARAGFELTELGGETQKCGFDPGMYINHGPWRIPFHHRSTLHYAKTFGVELELFNNDNDASYTFFTKGTGPLAGKAFRKMELAADIRGYAGEFLAKAAKAGSLDGAMTAADRELFIEYLVGEAYLSKKDLSYTGTEGRGWIEAPGGGLHPGIASTPYSLQDVLHSGAWKTLHSVAGWDQQNTMFQPKGGMYMLPSGFMPSVGRFISYSTVVERIRHDAKGVDVSVVDASGARRVVHGDYCLCTIPLSVLKGIDHGMSRAKAIAMGGAAYAPVGKIGLQMKRRFWEDDHAIYGGHVFTDDGDINDLALPSTNWHGQKGVLLGYYNFFGNAAKISALSPAARTELALTFGQKVFPQYRDSFETSFSVAWHRVKYNLGGWAMWSDEARAKDYPVLLQPDGRVFLAGEHLSYIGGWQAGAIESSWSQIAALHVAASKA